jgi:adenylosuccinate synthase
VYKDLDGWSESIGGARKLEALPAQARAYLDFIAENTGIPLYLVSVGPKRDETVVLHNPLL